MFANCILFNIDLVGFHLSAHLTRLFCMLKLKISFYILPQPQAPLFIMHIWNTNKTPLFSKEMECCMPNKKRTMFYRHKQLTSKCIKCFNQTKQWKRNTQFIRISKKSQIFRLKHSSGLHNSKIWKTINGEFITSNKNLPWWQLDSTGFLQKTNTHLRKGKSTILKQK